MRLGSLTIRLIASASFLCLACSEKSTGLDAQGSTSAETTTASNSAATTDAPQPSIDDEYCAQFDKDEAACQAAAAPDAPIQCAIFDPFGYPAELVETDDGPLCDTSPGSDFEAQLCRAVEYTPWACDLDPPTEATEVCSRQVPFGFWTEGRRSAAYSFDLPCHFRPVGFETCWEDPIPACWCACFPRTPCEGPLCDPEDATATSGGTGSTGSSGSGTGTSSGAGMTLH